MHIEFLRLTSGFSMPDYWEEGITDVWVQGDRGGFSRFIDLLKAAYASTTVMHCEALPSYSMFVAVCPVAQSPSDRPRLRLVERLVSRSHTHFELVIRANAGGLSHLIDLLEVAAQDQQKNDHWHVDLLDPVLVQRSVSLNIRQAVPEWDRDAPDWNQAEEIVSHLHRPPELPEVKEYHLPGPYESPEVAKIYLKHWASRY